MNNNELKQKELSVFLSEIPFFFFLFTLYNGFFKLPQEPKLTVSGGGARSASALLFRKQMK